MPSFSPQRMLLLIALSLLASIFMRYEWRLVLLAFAGMLLAILLDTLTEQVERFTHLRSTLAYLVTLLSLGGLVAGGLLLLVPEAVKQFDQLATVLPTSLHSLEADLNKHRWGASLMHVVHRAMSGNSLTSKLPLLTTAVTRGTVDLLVIVVIGFFGALNPKAYTAGMLMLLPLQHRKRARQIGSDAVSTLRWWLLGQMVPMVVLGLASMISLWLLHVPLAFSLGLLTGVMIFVPYVGTVLSSLPAILLAFEQGPQTALLVLLLYTIFHCTEGYFLTPLVQKRAVLLPPILTVLVQFFMWSFGGLLGVAVAAPLAAVALLLAKKLYLEPLAAEPYSL